MPFMEDHFNEDQQVDVPGSPHGQEWYHGGIKDNEAEYRLKLGGRGDDGAFLVYDGKRKGEHYYLLVLYRRKPQRLLITRRATDGKYILGWDIHGSITYASVADVINKHKEGMFGFGGQLLPLPGGAAVKLQGYVLYKEKY